MLLLILKNNYFCECPTNISFKMFRTQTRIFNFCMEKKTTREAIMSFFHLLIGNCVNVTSKMRTYPQIYKT